MNFKDYINSLPKTEKEAKNKLKFSPEFAIDFVEDINVNYFLLYEAVTPEQKEVEQN